MITQAASKNCAPFITCITKIDGTTTDDAGDLDLVIHMYNLLEYSSNYSDMSGNLWFSSKDKTTNFNNDVSNVNSFKSILSVKLNYWETLKPMEQMKCKVKQQWPYY